MIDEMAEVREYLGGKAPARKLEYRCTYMLARYFVNQGMDEQTATREILRWGRDVGFHFTVRVSRVVYYALIKPRPLTDGVVVYINEDDIAEIRSRFRKPKIRLLALGLIAYAKAHLAEPGLQPGTFDISVIGLCDWLGLNRASVYRWLEKMAEEGFLKQTFVRKREKRMFNPPSRFTLLIPLTNSGPYAVRENNVFDIADALLQ